jgi:hypothetical protein
MSERVPAKQPERTPVPENQAEQSGEDSEFTGNGYEDVRSGQESAEDAAEVQANERLRTDAEILGKRYPVSQMIRGAGNNLQRGKERVAAAWNNAKDRPVLMKDKFMCNLAQSSYDRRKAKLEKVAHLSDNHPLKKFRMKKVQKAKDRLEMRKADIQRRENQINARIDTVKNSYEARRKAIVAELSGRRDNALARKALREKLRDQGAGRLEARRIAREHVNSIPEKQRRRIASAIMNNVEAAKRSQEASREAKYAETASAYAQNRVESLGRQIDQTKADLENTRQQSTEIANMETSLVSAKENVASLQKEAESLPDNSADKNRVMEALKQAENSQRTIEKAIADHHQRLNELEKRKTRLERELIQAQTDAESAKQALEARAREETEAKRKAETAKQAKNQHVEETFV